ncbi:MAG: hypothetical protein LCH93_13555 [Proteobacteria bacterium]|nr:hypothetical protein [Pseudomonadota bacterium]
MFRLPTRHTFLRAAAVAGTLLPAGIVAQRGLVGGGLPADLLDPAICRASFGEPGRGRGVASFQSRHRVQRPAGI